MRKYNRNERVTCEVCQKKYIKQHKARHYKTKYHKLIEYCKKIMSAHYNKYGADNRSNDKQIIEQQGDIEINKT